jgi:transcriptional regulator with XRE-family HTH domain
MSTATGVSGLPLLLQELGNFPLMIDPRLKELADKIRALVEASPYQAVEIARQLGVDKSAVSKWISGERTPTMKNLIDLADILQIDMQELWTGPSAVPSTPEQRMMIELMGGMTLEQQQAWLAATAAAFKKGG